MGRVEQSEHIIRLVLADETLTRDQRATLRRYERDLRAGDLAVGTRAKYLSVLRDFGRAAGKPYEKVGKEDVLQFFEVRAKELAPGSVMRYKVDVKRFFKWLNGGDFPEWIRSLKTSRRNHTLPVEADDLPTGDEVRAMIEALIHPRDKAMVAVLWESACRAGEVLGLRVGSVRFDEHGAIVHVDGKTGQRRIRLIHSTPYLQVWMNNHPARDNRDAPLWPRLDSRNGWTAIDHLALYFVVRKAAERAGVRRKVHPHLLRHSRLTELARLGLSEQKLKVLAGWEPDSRMASVYIHLSGKDLDEDLLRLAGELPAEEAPKPKGPLKPRVCPRCETKNPADSAYCYKCSHVLDEKVALGLEESKDELLRRLLLNEEVQRILGAQATGDGRIAFRVPGTGLPKTEE